MYNSYTHGHLLVVVYSGNITLHDHQCFTNAIQQMVAEKEEIYVIALMQNGSQFVKNIPELIQVFLMTNTAMKQIRRFYNLEYNPMVGFITNVVSKVLDINSNLVEVKTLPKLYAAIERDAELYPKLAEALLDWELIKSEVEAGIG